MSNDKHEGSRAPEAARSDEEFPTNDDGAEFVSKGSGNSTSGRRASARAIRVPRSYYAGSLQQDTELHLDKKTSHHLLTVLRMKMGDRITLFNGDGYNYQATLISGPRQSSSKLALLQISTSNAALSESDLAVTLVQCVSRPERMDISLRQAVELGVTRIQPVYSRHSVKVGDESRALKKQQHWQSIVISACEQSGRCVVPQLCEATSYDQWLAQPMNPDNTHYVLSPTATQSLTQHAHGLTGYSTTHTTTLIIGPESGLDNDEIDRAVQAGAVPVHMGRRILRTETAGPTCIALLQSILGDLQP